jgi:type-F conjugative transfer system pilin assembly protein TrbC
MLRILGYIFSILYLINISEACDIEKEVKNYDNPALIEKYRAEAKELMDNAPKKEPYESKKMKQKGEQNNYERKLVFISLSQGKSSIKNIVKEARNHGFTPVLRGFKDGNYKETVDFLQEIIENTGYGVVIDPESFKEFDVKLVPTFVVVNGKKFNKVAGNIGFEYVMMLFDQSGDK